MNVKYVDRVTSGAPYAPYLYQAVAIASDGKILNYMRYCEQSEDELKSLPTLRRFFSEDAEEGFRQYEKDLVDQKRSPHKAG